MKALLSFGRKAAEADGDEHRQYKKANLGESNKLYYNAELQMWVEKGKEAEARAAKLATAAPPPAPAAMASAADVTAPNANGHSAGPPPAAQKYSRGLSIKDRYIAQPVGGVGAGGSGPPSGRGLLPGAAAGGLVPGIPKPAGGALVPRVGSFFMPTPTASEAASEPAGDSSTPGTMSMSQSGLSMDALVAGSGPPSQPGPAMRVESGHNGHAGFFVPSMPAAAGRESSGSSPGDEELPAASAAESEANGLSADRLSSSGGGRAPAASSSQNLSFASWSGSGSTKRSPYWQPGSVHQQQYTAGTNGVDVEADHPAKQQKQFPEQHPCSPRSPQLPQPQQEHQYQQRALQQVQGPSAEADSNGNAAHSGHAGYDAAVKDSFAPAAVGEDALALAGTQAGVSGVGWDLGITSDPLDLSAGIDTAVSGAVTPSAWGNNQPVVAEVLDPESGDAAATAGTGWATDICQHDPEANAVDATESAAVLASSADGYASHDYGQQAVWGQQGDAQPAYGQYVGYQHAGGAEQQWPQHFSQQSTEDRVPYQQQEYHNSNGYGHYGQHGSLYSQDQQQVIHSHLAPRSAVAAVADQAMTEVLQPVHPELPGIATTFGASNSEEPELSSRSQHHQGTAPTAAAGFLDASSSYQSAPGSAPHPSRATSGGLHGGLGSGLAPARSSSLHITTKGSVASLLPPARPSFNGSTGSPPRDSSALTLPATAVAGDSSFVTTVRPSSPYARPVSPLARTNTGMSDLSADIKVAAQGFPIPSPPTAGLGKPGIFMPGLPNGQQCENTTPWRPSAPGADATAGNSSWQPGNQQQQQQPQDALAAPSVTHNGYVGPHYAMVNGPTAVSSNKEPWIPTDNKCLPAHSAQDAAGRVKHSKRVHYYDEFLQQSIAEVNWKLHPFEQPGKLNKLTPIEKFEQEQERQKQQHRTRGKAKRGPAFYLKQMELRQKLPAGAKPSLSEPVVLPSHAAALMGPGDSTVSDACITDWQQHKESCGRQQQQQQGSDGPVTPKRATSAEAAAEDGSAGEKTPESKFVPHVTDNEADSLPGAAPGAFEQQTLAPGAAVVDGHAQFGNSYGVYDPLHHQLEQGTSAAAAAGGSSAAPADSAVTAAENDTGAVAEQVQQEGDAAPSWPAEWSLCTPEMQQAWVQWCCPDYLPWLQSTEYQPWFEQQYNFSMQQQQQQQVAEQHDATAQVQAEPLNTSAAAAGVAEGEQQPEQQLIGWGTPEVSPGKDVEGASQAAAVSWEEGQLDDAVPGLATAVDPAQLGAAAPVQQLDEQAAAVLEAAADGWGDEGVVPDALATPAEPSIADAGECVTSNTPEAVVAAVTAEGVVEQVVCRSARVSSSTGLASQPSTATAAAAAASKAIVSQVLDNIIRGHGQNEVAMTAQQAGEHLEASANGNGWGTRWATEELAQHRTAAEAEGAVGTAVIGAAAVEAAVATMDGFCSDWVASEVSVAADGSVVAAAGAEGQEDKIQQAEHDGDSGYPLDWTEMRTSIAAFPDSAGQLAQYKEAFIGWGDAFFTSVGTAWPAQLQAAGSRTAAALAAETADLDQGIEMFSEQQLQHRPLAGIFGRSGFEIEDLLSSLEL